MIGVLYASSSTMYLVDMTLSILTYIHSMFYNCSFVYLFNYLLKTSHIFTSLVDIEGIFAITQKTKLEMLNDK